MRNSRVKINKTIFLLVGLTIACLSLASFVEAAFKIEVSFPEIVKGDKITEETTLPQLFKYIFNIFIVVAVLATIFSLFYGGIRYLTSTGNPDVMMAAKQRVTNSAIGLGILLVSYLLLYIVNPQLTILRIRKVPVVTGVILLNEAAMDDFETMNVLMYGDLEEIEKKVEKLLQASPDEPKADYLMWSMSDLTAKFGKLELGESTNPSFWGLPSARDPMMEPYIDERETHQYPFGKDSFNFKDFKLAGIYFLPGSNAKVRTYFYRDFRSPNGFNEYIYPNCSKETGPCPLKFLSEGYPIAERKDDMGISLGVHYMKSVPLSITLQGLGRGVYLYSGTPGEEIQLQAYDSIPHLGALSYKFDNKTKKIEIRNWLEEDGEYKKATNFLAILYEDTQFSGNLRLFFERFTVAGIPTIAKGVWGNLPEDRPETSENDSVLDFNKDGTEDTFSFLGRVENPSSAKVFPMPATDEGWTEWFKGAGGDGCKVTLCAERGLPLGEADNPEACIVQPFDGRFLEAQDIVEEVKIRLDRDGKPGWDKDAEGNWLKETVPLNNNVRSLKIEGSCIAVLFENPTNDWDGGGGYSEVLTPWSEEYEEYKGYQDLTVDNSYYGHRTGRCDCKLREFWGVLKFDDCKPCASSLAIFPVVGTAATYTLIGTGASQGTCKGFTCVDSSLNFCQPQPASCAISDISNDEIETAASGYSICPNLNTVNAIKAIMARESGGKISSVSPAGACGLMQFLPSTANNDPSLKSKCGITDNITCDWLTNSANAKAQICLAIKFLEGQVSKCGCNIRHLAARYNSGMQGQLDACDESENCGRKASQDGGECLQCPGSSFTRRWECLWDDNAHTLCNSREREGHPGFSETRKYVPQVEYCYNYFNQ